MSPWLLVLVPALAALVGLASGRDDRIARGAAVGGSALTLLLAVVGWAVGSPSEVFTITPALDVGDLQVPLGVLNDPTRWAVASVVALVTLAVQVYSTWYLETDDRYPRFATTVSLFSAAMLLVVVSGDLVLTVVGWEVMGWCSYLLIGHWSRRHSARRAAHKAFLVTRVADIGFVLGVIGLAAGARSTGLAQVIGAWDRPTECIDTQTATGLTVGQALTACSAPDGTLRAVLLTLVVIGVLGKSAQLPFQDWLADAMEGPTPASALIHAATMVAAGTVVLAALFPLLSVSQTPRWVLGIAVSLTMLLAAVLAFAQSDLKRLLAWSTVSQVGVMLSALAAAPPEAGPDAGLFHLWSHAIFKALLFLAIGWAGLAVGGTAAKALRGSALATPAAAGVLPLRPALAGRCSARGRWPVQGARRRGVVGGRGRVGAGRHRARRPDPHRRGHRGLLHPCLPVADRSRAPGPAERAGHTGGAGCARRAGRAERHRWPRAAHRRLPGGARPRSSGW